VVFAGICFLIILKKSMGPARVAAVIRARRAAMFPQFKKRNKESGMVLYIVLMTAIVIMIFSVSILTQSLNETNYAQQQIDQIASDQLAKGLFWNTYSASYSAGQIVSLAPTAYSTVLNGRNYQVSLTAVGGGYNVNASYDTFL
jgi:hypothetical protein